MTNNPCMMQLSILIKRANEAGKGITWGAVICRVSQITLSKCLEPLGEWAAWSYMPYPLKNNINSNGFGKMWLELLHHCDIQLYLQLVFQNRGRMISLAFRVYKRRQAQAQTIKVQIKSQEGINILNLKPPGLFGRGSRREITFPSESMKHSGVLRVAWSLGGAFRLMSFMPGLWQPGAGRGHIKDSHTT